MRSSGTLKKRRMSALVSAETAMTASAISMAVFSTQQEIVVTAAKLLALPRAQRFERMHGQHHRDAVVELRHDAREVRVPRVQMDEVGVDVRGVPIETTLGRAKDRMKLLGRGIAGGVEPKTGGLERGGVDTRFSVFLAVTAHFHRHQFRPVHAKDTPRGHPLRHRSAADIHWSGQATTCGNCAARGAIRAVSI